MNIVVKKDVKPALYKKSDLCLPEIKLRGLVPNSYIRVSMSVVYIPRIGLPIFLQQSMNMETGRQKL
jgi:hypothetical protein